MHRNKVRTLVVPGERASRLVEALKAGKFFGRKVSYLYSGRSMLFWDFLVSLVLAAGVFTIDYFPKQSSDQTLMSLSVVPSAIFVGGLLFMVGKMMIVDARYWLPTLHGVIKALRKK